MGRQQTPVKPGSAAKTKKGSALKPHSRAAAAGTPAKPKFKQQPKSEDDDFGLNGGDIGSSEQYYSESEEPSSGDEGPQHGGRCSGCCRCLAAAARCRRPCVAAPDVAGCPQTQLHGSGLRNTSDRHSARDAALLPR